MTKKEYFQQAAWLDKQIRSLLGRRKRSGR